MNHETFNLQEAISVLERSPASIFALLNGREANLATLASINLSEADLERKGLHPALGEVTLGQLLATWVVHDLDHIAQLARTMAKVYSDAVGPWSVYLSILRDRL